MLVLATGGSSGIEPGMRNGEKAELVIEADSSFASAKRSMSLEAGDTFRSAGCRLHDERIVAWHDVLV